jgi:hypothetical protein
MRSISSSAGTRPMVNPMSDIEQIAKAKAMREARARAPAKPEFKIGNADNGRRDRKRADVKLKRFD